MSTTTEPGPVAGAALLFLGTIATMTIFVLWPFIGAPPLIIGGLVGLLLVIGGLLKSEEVSRR